jgi:hypothetical protein
MYSAWRRKYSEAKKKEVTASNILFHAVRRKKESRLTASKPQPAPTPPKYSLGGQLAPGRGTKLRNDQAKYLLEDRKNSRDAKRALSEATRERELPWMVDGVEITGDPNFRPQVTAPVARFTAARNQKAAELRNQRFKTLGKGFELKKKLKPLPRKSKKQLSR